MKKLISFLVIFFVTASVTLNAQDFGRKGTWEIGGLVMYANNTIVTNGETEINGVGTSVSLFFINVPVYYLIADGLQIGVVPEFVSANVSSGDNDLTLSLFGGFFSTAYVFKTGGSVFPFIEGRIGYNSITQSQSGSSPLSKGSGITQEEIDETFSGIGWGFSGGIKVQLGKAALLNLGVGYQQRTANHEDDTDDLRDGLNVISVLAGFSVYLGR